MNTPSHPLNPPAGGAAGALVSEGFKVEPLNGFEPLNPSTSHPLNSAPPQPLNTSTPQPAPSAFANIYAGKRVLVTGHTGFKGAWLCEWLLSLGAEVTGFALPPPTTPSLFDQLQLTPRLRHIVGDVRDLAAVRCAVEQAKPDFVFHLAAQPLVRLSYDYPVDTYAVNIMGTVNVLEALRCYQNELKGETVEKLKGLESGNPSTSQPLNASTSGAASAPGRVIAAVMITTDKCYENKEWVHSYREEDPMGGYDPYSSSKGAAELVIASYRRSYFSAPDSPVKLASARAGNVIGGGDWALDRIVPDCIRSLSRGESIPVRNKIATRPWQHVLEPLSGYLWLGACLATTRGSEGLKEEGLNGFLASQRFNDSTFQLALHSAFNFGPALASNRTVAELVQEILKHWPGEWADMSDPKAVHEAKLLNLATDKAHHFLGWDPAWNFSETIAKTVRWYRAACGPGAGSEGLNVETLKSYAPSTSQPLNHSTIGAIRALTTSQIAEYTAAARAAGIAWAR